MAKAFEGQQLRRIDFGGNFLGTRKRDILVIPIVNDERLRTDGLQQPYDREAIERPPAESFEPTFEGMLSGNRQAPMPGKSRCDL